MIFYAKITHEKLDFTPILNFSAKIQIIIICEKYSLFGPFSPDYVGQGVSRSLADNPALGVVDGISFVKQFLNFRPDYNI